MIKSESVRRRNLVEYEGRIFEIDSISEDFPTLNTSEFGIGVVDWNNVNPIALTEEWLLKFGFEKAFELEENLYTKGDWWVNLDEYQNFGNIENIDFSLYCYEELNVHELQNLYFALTGEELKIKES